MSDHQRTNDKCISRNPPLEKQSKSKRKLKNELICDRIDSGENLGPVEEQFISKTYEIIMDIGETSVNEFIRIQKRKVDEISNQIRETIKERMASQLQKMKRCIQSSVKAKYEKKLLEFTNDAKEKFNKSILAAESEMKYSCEEKLKQHAIDEEKITLKNIEKSLVEREEYLKQEFRFIKEQNLVDLNDYYQQLNSAYRCEFKGKLNYLIKKHDENYKKTKGSLANSYSEELNLMKLNLENKLFSKNNKIISELSSLKNDKKKAKETEYLEKSKKLMQREEEILFVKENIKNVLKNYVKLVNMKEQQSSNGNYGIDENKLFEKYLSRPTEVDFEQWIQRNE